MLQSLALGSGERFLELGAHSGLMVMDGGDLRSQRDWVRQERRQESEGQPWLRIRCEWAQRPAPCAFMSAAPGFGSRRGPCTRVSSHRGWGGGSRDPRGSHLTGWGVRQGAAHTCQPHLSHLGRPSVPVEVPTVGSPETGRLHGNKSMVAGPASVTWGCCNKRPQTEGIKQQFWRLELESRWRRQAILSPEALGEGPSCLSSIWQLLVFLAHGCIPPVSHHPSSVRLSQISLSFLLRTPATGFRAQPDPG